MRYEVTMTYEASIDIEVEADNAEAAKQAAAEQLETTGVEIELWAMDFAPSKVLQLPAPYEYESAVRRIHELLSGTEWDAGTIEAVAFIIENIGEGEFHIEDSAPTDEVTR